MGNVFGKDEDHVRRDQGTTADLKVYADAREQLGELQAPVLLHADNPHERLYIAAMDGTGNSMRTDSPENWSAVAKIHDQLTKADKSVIKSGYVEGVGTQDEFLARTMDGWQANSFDERVETAYYNFCMQAKEWIDEDPQAKISIAGVGFSRGGEEVAALNRMIHERGIRNPEGAQIQRDDNGLITSVQYDLSCPPLVAPGKTPQVAMLFDPVSTNNTEHDRRLSPSTVGAFQIRSDDRRNEFKGDQLLPDGMSEDNRFFSVFVPGPHSTIGDSYRHNGFGVLSANMGFAFMNSLADRDYLIPQAVPQDPARYQKLYSEDHLVVYSTSYYDRHQQRGYTNQLGSDAQCKVAQPLPDCTLKAPVDPLLDAQVERRPVRLPEQAAPPLMPDAIKPSPISSGDAFNQLAEAAARGDAQAMRAASIAWGDGNAAQHWLGQGREYNSQQARLEAEAPVVPAVSGHVIRTTETPELQR